MSNDPLDKEVNFEGGVRGKFYRAGMVVHVPVYLEESVLNPLTEIAQRKGMQVSDLISDVLKRELAIAEVLR